MVYSNFHHCHCNGNELKSHFCFFQIIIFKFVSRIIGVIEFFISMPIYVFFLLGIINFIENIPANIGHFNVFNSWPGEKKVNEPHFVLHPFNS